MRTSQRGWIELSIRVNSLLGSTDHVHIHLAFSLQSDYKRGALSFLALYIDWAACCKYDLPADAEAKSYSQFVTILVFFEFAEVHKKFILVFGRDTASCITENHLKRQLAFNFLLQELCCEVLFWTVAVCLVGCRVYLSRSAYFSFFGWRRRG